MTTLKATFTVNTPMFLGGADNTSVAELRPTSFKGVLRFWWRALVWSQLGNVAAIREAEADLFGSADQSVGQSKVLLKLEADSPPRVLQAGSSLASGKPGASYLGYGVMDFRGDLTRPCLAAGLTFTATLRFKKGTSEEAIQGIIGALQAMAFFGGLGAKSRKGYGSLSLLSLERGDELLLEQPKTVNELKEQIALLVHEHVGMPSRSLPPYSALSDRSWAELLATGSDAFALLDHVGQAMQFYRSYGRESYGRERLVNRQPAEQNFADDHHLVLRAIQGTAPTTLPRRVVFGLPHNYQFSNGGGKARVSARQDRRASPLFLHIHRLATGEFAAIALALPAAFLPADSRISVHRTDLPAKVDFTVLREFVTGSKKNSTEKRFPRKQALITATQEA